MRGKMAFLAGLVIALGAGWAGFPYAVYTSRTEPVDFSHKVHADKAGTKCEDCHSFRDDGSFAGIPALDKCAGCHAAPMGATAAEKSFIDRNVTPQREPRWDSFARQPENVYFSHAVHVKRGNVECQTCHGALGRSDKLPRYQQDRISGYSRDIWGAGGRPGMTMNACIQCHNRQGREDSCLDCHK